MNATFQRERDKNYILIKDDGMLDEFSINMLCENNLTGFAKVECRSFNGEKMYYYDVSDYISLFDLSKEKNIDICLIRRILQALLSAMKLVDSYFLHSDGICLDPEYIFIGENQILFCYYPEGFTIEEKLCRLAEIMLTMINNADENAVVIIYQFYMLSKESNLSAHVILTKILFGRENVLSNETSIFNETEYGDDYRINENQPHNDFVSKEGRKQKSDFDMDSDIVINRNVNPDETQNIESFQNSSSNGMPAFVWYILLILVSFIYGLITILYLELDLWDFLMRREGVLSITFCIFGLCGFLLDRFFLKKFRNMKS